jgi:LysR family glycine cleavage system transcriptional activator
MRGDLKMFCDNDERKPMPAFQTLRAFEAVGRLSGIRRAAQDLQLDHAVVSRHLRSLEEWAGTQLIARQNGRAVLTDEGVRYHVRVSAALGELLDASVELLRRNSSRRLSIWCIHGFASQWLTCRLSDFQARYPELQLELRSTDSAPDFTRYEADVDIRYIAGDEPISAVTICSGVRRFEIARPPVVAVASPGRAALLPPLRTPADLLNAPLLHEESCQQWRIWLTARGVRVDGPLSGPRLWHAHLTVEAARRGQGVALANPFLLGDDFATGRLVRVLDDRPESRQIALGAYTFAARADRWQSTAITCFRRWLRSQTAGDEWHVLGGSRTPTLPAVQALTG